MAKKAYTDGGNIVLGSMLGLAHLISLTQSALRAVLSIMCGLMQKHVAKKDRGFCVVEVAL